MRLRTKFALLLLLIASFMASIAGFNILIDPYRFFDTPDIVGVNKNKAHFFYAQFLTKPYAVRRGDYDAIILGSSRAGSGFATEHPGWNDFHVYNYALAGTSPYLMWRSYQHAKSNGDLKRVMISLDFYMYNTYKDPQSAMLVDAYEERLSVTPANEVNHAYSARWFTDLFTSLFSSGNLSNSWSTLVEQSKIENGNARLATIFPSGFWINDRPPGMPQRQFFPRIEKQYVSKSWFPEPMRKFALIDDDGTSNLIYLQKILADCYRDDIEVTLIFTPFHARLAESLRAVDLWPVFEQWKREIVLLNEQEAAQAGRPDYPIWDFTGYNSITMEALPAPKDKFTRMQWHNDTTHISKAAGDLVQDIIWGTNDTSSVDFGKKVNSGNVDAVFAEINADREKYVAMFPDDAREVAESARKNHAKWVGP